MILRSLKKIPKNIVPQIVQAHAEILGEDLNEGANLVNLDIGVSHLKSEIDTQYYGFKSNSSGQDNTGQIIEAVLSFEMLKKTVGKELHRWYFGH